MDPRDDNNTPHKTLWYHLRKGFKRAHKARPISFYLLLAIPVALLLGVGMTTSTDSPRRFAFYLSIFFVFFFAILHRAIVDFIEISRGHFKEHEKVYRSTLGDDEFVSRLADRVGNPPEK